MAESNKTPIKTSLDLVVECHICGTWISTANGLLMRHMKKYHQRPRDKCMYPCPACTKLFIRKQNFDVHCKNVHQQLILALPPVILRPSLPTPNEPMIISKFTIPPHPFQFCIIKETSRYLSAKDNIIRPYDDINPGTTKPTPSSSAKKRPCPLPPNILTKENGILLPPDKCTQKIPKRVKNNTPPSNRKLSTYEVELEFNKQYRERQDRAGKDYDSDSQFKIPQKSPRKPSGNYMPPKKASPVDHKLIKEKVFKPSITHSPRLHTKENLTRVEKICAKSLNKDFMTSTEKPKISSTVSVPQGSTLNNPDNNIPTKELGIVRPTQYSPILSMPHKWNDFMDTPSNDEFDSFLSDSSINELLNSTSMRDPNELGTPPTCNLSDSSSVSIMTSTKEFKDIGTQTLPCTAKYHTDRLMDIIAELENMKITTNNMI